MQVGSQARSKALRRELVTARQIDALVAKLYIADVFQPAGEFPGRQEQREHDHGIISEPGEKKVLFAVSVSFRNWRKRMVHAYLPCQAMQRSRLVLLNSNTRFPLGHNKPPRGKRAHPEHIMRGIQKPPNDFTGQPTDIY